MQYITSCPACDTQFLLTKEHLMAYKGKVQCGNCEHIFNAKNRLTEISDDIHSAAEYQASLKNGLSQSASLADEKPIDAVISNVLEGVDLASTRVEPELAVTEATLADQAAFFNQPSTLTKPFDAEIHAPIEIEDLAADARVNKTKKKTNYWLVLLSALLALLAGLQTVYSMRTQITAKHPQFKPFLMQACATLLCEIALPKNLDLFSIDDSDMQEDDEHENVIKFSSLLINNASYTQAYPSIELTLTAADDEPVLRRIIKPEEYLKDNKDIASGIGAREDLRVNLAISIKDLAVAGYRVLLVD